MATNKRRAKQLIERLVALDQAGVRVTCQWINPGGLRFSCSSPAELKPLRVDFGEELNLLGHYYVYTRLRPLWMVPEREAVLRIADLFGFPRPEYTRVDLVVT